MDDCSLILKGDVFLWTPKLKPLWASINSPIMGAAGVLKVERE